MSTYGVVMVTGAGHGIGKATAARLAAEGARLVLGDINPHTLAETAAACASAGADVWTAEYDQRVSASVDRMFASGADHFGGLDGVANIAGIYPTGTVEHTDDDLWANVLGTNLTGVFYCCRAAVRIMTAQGSGSIVNVSSGAAEIPYSGIAAYSASKGGIEALTRALAKEVAPEVRVNAVAPGPTATWPEATAGDGTAESDDAPTDPFAAAALITEGIPLGRWMRPEEIADGIAFLLSPAAAAIYGQVLRVNGGNHMA